MNGLSAKARVTFGLVGLGLVVGTGNALGQALGETRDCVIGPHAVVDLGAAVPGQLEEVAVERTDEVRAGQVIARLESAVERASLELARAWASIDSEIRIEELGRSLDRRRHARVSRLYENRVVALDDKEASETEAARAAVRVRQAEERRWIREIDVRKAEASLERRTVRSPIDGVVVERYRAAGEYVENQPIVRIAQLDPLQVETILPMSEFGAVVPGMVAEVRPENDPGAPLEAVVRLVDRTGDPASGTFGVRLALANPDGRIPAGLKCSMRFLPGRTAAVPGSAASPPTPDGTVPAPSGAGDGTPRPDTPARGADASPDQATPTTPRAASSQAASPASPKPHFESPSDDERAPPDPEVLSTGLVEARASDVARPEAETARAVTAEETDAPAATPEPPATLACAAIGPLGSLGEARSLADALSADGGEAWAEGGRVTERAGFIVVTAAQPDRDAAQQLGARLSAAGVEDLQVMGAGRYANRVSLGVYAHARLGEVRRDTVTALGFDAEVLERTRSVTRWWVHTNRPARFAVDALDVRGPDAPAVAPRACETDSTHRAGLGTAPSSAS